ncbi:MAG: hypothetical protein U5N86_08200 [Planctomycetota bacterium]|nr:hypothetical protein [Planctomycetota bacterium]
MEVPFIKTEALGNDFVLVDALKDNSLFEKLAPYVPAICDRRRGIGADGVLFLVSGSDVPYMMRLVNADGSESEMCGNGLRCIAHYLRSEGR